MKFIRNHAKAVIAAIVFTLVAAATVIAQDAINFGTLPVNILAGRLYLGKAIPLVFEGATADAYQTTLTVADPTAARTWTIPDAASDTFVGKATTDTLTNKTLTAPTLTAVAITGTSTIGNGMTITTPVISGAITGTYSLGGTPTISGAIAATLSNTGTLTMPSATGGLPTVLYCGSTGSGNQTCSPAVAAATTKIYAGHSTMSSNAAVITFPTAFASTTYDCVANDITTRANPVQMISTSANTATITNTTGASDVINWVCVGQ